MESIGGCYAFILSDPELRQGLIRDAERSRRRGLTANSSHVLRRWFVDALHGLASRVDPAPRTLEFRPAPSSTLP
jgi:hypothetical protein